MSSNGVFLPLAGTLPARHARRLRVLAAACLAAVAAVSLLAAAGASGSLAAGGLSLAAAACAAGVVFARAALVKQERRGWLAIALALVLSAAAASYAAVAFGNTAVRPVPSPQDVLLLGCYALIYVSFTLLLRARVPRCPKGVWLDGLLCSLCVAAFGAAFVLEPVVERTSDGLIAMALNVAFPLVDLMLVALVMGSFVLTGWRPGRGWLLLGLGIAALATGDIVFLFQTTDGEAMPGSLVSFVWALPPALAALAAWERPRRMESRTEGWPVVVPPAVFALAALGLLVYGNLVGMGPLALALAAGAVLTAFARVLFTLREVRQLAESRRQALTDDLTGLPNRRSFQRELARLTDASRSRPALALVMIDLDGFKELNDTLGHHAGDLVLEQLGPRLRGAVRPGDFLARLGGDEFAVLMPGVSDGGAAELVAERIRSAVRAGFTLAEMNVRVDASAGIALFPGHADSGSVLFQRADIAMYQAKAEQAGCRLYDASRDRHSRDRLELTGQLRDAIRDDQLVVHYQPKACMADGRIVGVEALVRWEHPERGLVPPNEFIPLAEQTGLMRPLTVSVLGRSLRAVKRWEERGLALSVAVNVAPANVLDAEFPATVARMLAAAQIHPSRLILEITENSVMTDPERGAAVLRELQALGVELALDDFGTGFSSLSYLTRLPVSELKIDRSFVADLASGNNEVIVSSVADLGRSLGLRVVAEGIEDLATWGSLCEHGIDEAQGFYLARPMPEDELLAWLEGYEPELLGLTLTTART